MKLSPGRFLLRNFVPDQITGEETWYLPDFFRWLHLFLYWWRHDVVELIDLEHIQGITDVRKL